MSEQKQAIWLRIILGILTFFILITVIPAYFNTDQNPALANLSGHPAVSLGSLAGAFLARQLALSLIALYGVIKGSRQPMLIGAFAIAFFNLHDAIFLYVIGGNVVGATAGAILGGLALVVMIFVYRKKT